MAAVLILWRRDLPDENRDDGTLNARKAVLALAIGLGIGLYDGIVGPGTGTFAIIAFTTLMGFDLRTAGGNGKVLNLASNYASLFTYLMNGLVVFHIGIPCAVSNILGNLLGVPFRPEKGCTLHPSHDAGGAGAAGAGRQRPGGPAVPRIRH